MDNAEFLGNEDLREARKVRALERIADALEHANRISFYTLSPLQQSRINYATELHQEAAKDELHTSNRIPTSDD